MGCNCGGGGSKVAYAVLLKNGQQAPGSPFANSSKARQVALASNGKVKLVPKPTSGPRA